MTNDEALMIIIKENVLLKQKLFKIGCILDCDFLTEQTRLINISDLISDVTEESNLYETDD